MAACLRVASIILLAAVLGRAVVALRDAVPADGSPGAKVRVDGGWLSGAAVSRGVRSYLGIPYAAPPVGEWRWRKPRAAPAWTGVRAADRFGAQCMQRRIFGDMVFRSPGMSEDCLYLNVWAPARRAAGPLPVLVYFHGGGFIAGDGSEPRYDGANLAARGLVAVTLNHRLGRFGFLSHPELSAESPTHGSGNYGLQDQCAALHWVARNIAAFGGDPRRITIAGESAGSWSVSAQMVSPACRALVAGAIGESGSVVDAGQVQALAEAEAEGVRFQRAAGASDLAGLRALDAAAILALDARGGGEGARPAVDGDFFPRQPELMYADGEQAHVPLLAGTNSMEGDWPMVLGHAAPTVEAYRAALRAAFGLRAQALFDLYPASDDAGVKHAARELASDEVITQATWRWVDLAARARPDATYWYRYERPRPATVAGDQPPMEAANHSAEIEYALGNLDGNRIYAWTAEDRAVSRVMSGYFARFILTGDPNGEGLPAWRPYAAGRIQVIDVRTRSEPDTARARHEALDTLVH